MSVEIPGVEVQFFFDEEVPVNGPVVIVTTRKAEEGAVIEVYSKGCPAESLPSLLHVIATTLEERP